ncbi:MAG: hypothetical protein MI799_16540, partial [Desulfobacterales bacterium]|nr:hypothetical protein [Desulfobacterales bacterium]
MFKKITVLLLALTLMLTMMVGCGGDNDATNAPADSSGNVAEAADPAEMDLEEVTLTWYFIGNGQQEDVALIEEAATKYLMEKGLNVNLKLQCFDWGSYDQKLRTMIAAREEFDICFTASWANEYQ